MFFLVSLKFSFRLKKQTTENLVQLYVFQNLVQTNKSLMKHFFYCFSVGATSKTCYFSENLTNFGMGYKSEQI